MLYFFRYRVELAVMIVEGIGSSSAATAGK